MQSGQAKMRGFGRCPYCRAMVYQDPKAVIYYCSKCRTPIRGKNPEPTDETEYALSQLEILSADTASVFSDEPETSNTKHSVADAEDDDVPRPWLSGSTRYRETGASSSPYRAFGSVRTGPGSGGLNDEQTGGGRSGSSSPLHSRVSELRPSSRRTRRPLSGNMDALRDDEGSSTGSESDAPAPALSRRRRASPLCSQELDASMDLSGHEPTRSPLTDPAFQKDLLQALDNLRKVIAAVEQPRGGYADADELRHARMPPRTSASCNESGSAAGTATRRNSRLMRRLESQLVQALPAAAGPRRDRSTSSSSSSSSASSGRRGGGHERRRAWTHRHHCRPILGGTPFVVCDKCSEILQLPAALSVDSTARLECGGCGEPLALTLPASGGSTDRPRKIFSAPQPGVSSGADEHALARSSLSGEQRRPVAEEGPLHRVLGYSSVSSVLRSRRYGD